MKKYLVLIFIITLCCIPIISYALPVEYCLEVDDYGELYIDSILVASYDAYPAGGDFTGILDLDQGWHDIEITYKNRWGSNALILHQRDFDDMSMTVVPLEYLRSADLSGNIINGLTAEYYDLNGNYVTTIYGEGPIEHGARYDASYNLLTYYQGVWPDPWAGIYNGWSTFEERLSGEIYVPSSSVPEPSSMLLFVTLLVGLAGSGKLFRVFPD